MRKLLMTILYTAWSILPIHASPICMKLYGVITEFKTQKPLGATIYLKTPTKKTKIGISSPLDGRFSLAIECEASYLLIECPGYRNQVLQLNSSINSNTNYPIGLIIPMISVDNQDKDKPYQQSEQRHFEQTITKGSEKQVQHNIFTIKDAISGLSIAGQCCFVFTNTGKRRCYVTDNSGHLQVDFNQKDIIALEVSSSGYNTYSGNLVVETLRGQQLSHKILLTKELTILSVLLPRTGDFQIGLRKGQLDLTPLKQSGNEKTALIASGLSPGAYELTFTNKKNLAVSIKKLSIVTGLNIVQIPDAPSQPLATRDTVLQTILLNVDSLSPVFFEKSSYILQPPSKTYLSKIASYLRQRPDLKIQIIGHTDREGDEKRNRILSEYRARVVAFYLRSDGIDENRLNLLWHGSQYAIDPNNDETTKSHNRRVELKIEAFY